LYHLRDFSQQTGEQQDVSTERMPQNGFSTDNLKSPSLNKINKKKRETPN